MLRGVKTAQKKKRGQREADSRPAQQPKAKADAIRDPLRSRDTDPLKAAELQDNIVQTRRRRRRRKKKKREEEENQKEELLGAPIAEAEDLIEDLLINTELDEEALNLQTLAEDDLEVEEVVELFEIDELGKLMNELADLDALGFESPVVEALVDEELEKAQDATLNGFPNAFVEAEDMIFNEIQSQKRPFDDADTRMQVTPMSWVPNRIKDPIGRRAMDEPLVDRGLNHAVKEDVTTRDEDNDIGVRTRRRFTPFVPTADQVTAGLSDSSAQIEVTDIVRVIQTYHETMQSNPDLGKTFLLGAIRMMGQFVDREETRTDLKEGTTALEYLAGPLLTSIITDMLHHESFFDWDVDMIFYRQWKSMALRVRRKAQEKIDAQNEQRDKEEEAAEKADMLDQVPEGELLEWSMDNPYDALELYEDPDLRNRYAERLMDELFGEESIVAFLEQADALDAASEAMTDEETGADPRVEMLREAFLDMDMGRLEALRGLEEMEELIPLVQQSIDAIGGLDPILRGIVMSMMNLYGTSASGLEAAARNNPVHTVLTVTRGPETRPIPQATIRPGDPNEVASSGRFSEEEEEEEEEDTPEDGDGDGDDENDEPADGG